MLLLALTFFAQISFAGQTWLTWNTRSGLPSNNLTCLAIKKGVMAVGSDNGIGLFCDGDSRWKKVNDYSEKMVGLAIRSMDFDGYGNLWAATSSGIFCVELEKFPEEPPVVSYYGIDSGLATVDTEVLQVVGNTLYVGCFGGWIYKTNIFHKAAGVSFSVVDSMNIGKTETNKIVSIGITALAMDYPGGGIYSTKGKGLVRADNGNDILNEGELFSDWVNDFWSFTKSGGECIIAVTQNHMGLIKNLRMIGTAQLPEKDTWISCLTTCPDEERDVVKYKVKKEDRALDELLGTRILYVGTNGKGLWKFDEGRWYNFTSLNSALPSDTINKVYFLPGARKIAVLTDAGLTMFGIEDYSQYDEFEFKGTTPFFAKTFWPFMSFWGPRVYGYPSHKCYPIEPFIAYKKILRGKDLWISHEKGISRYVFPASPLLGTMQVNYKLAGRYESPKNDPQTNTLLEDNSTALEKPEFKDGECTWHHYCKEQPLDFMTAKLDEIYSSLDMKTLCGPLNQLVIEAENFEDVTAEQIAETIEVASNTINYPPVIVIKTKAGLFDKEGRQLFSIASQNRPCPFHTIPSVEIVDFDVDFDERVWAVFDENRLFMLDSSVNAKQDFSDEWVEISEGQLPWAKYEEILCVKRIGSCMYFGTKSSGLYMLEKAHCLEPEDITSVSWKRIDMDTKEDDLTSPCSVKSVALWKTIHGNRVAILHEQSLSIFDGESLVKIPVPKRRYTCMAVDKFNRLWVGALSGLLYVEPDLKIKDILTAECGFKSDRITAIAAAPDDADYPFIIAVAYNKDFDPDGKFRNGDIPPALFCETGNPYRLRAKLAGNNTGAINLWDGKMWERFSRPGVSSLLFDQRYLWFTNNVRIMRLFLPVEVVSY